MAGNTAGDRIHGAVDHTGNFCGPDAPVQYACGLAFRTDMEVGLKIETTRTLADSSVKYCAYAGVRHALLVLHHPGCATDFGTDDTAMAFCRDHNVQHVLHGHGVVHLCGQEAATGPEVAALQHGVKMVPRVA